MVNKIGLFMCFGVFLMFCLHWRVDAQVNCTATGAGRFPTTNDTTCKNYTLCVYSTNTTSFVSYNYVCPTTSLFNPNSQLCTTNYTCGTNTTSGVCTTAGRFANTNDTTCRSYFLCVLATNGTYFTYNYTCPTTSLFSPIIRRCTTNYTCASSG